MKKKQNEDKSLIPSSIKKYFWDVNKDEVDIKKHKRYIITRIIDYGNLDDIRWMKDNYTEEEIIEVIKKSKGLSRKSAYFWSAYYNIPKEDIICLKEFYPRRLRLL